MHGINITIPTPAYVMHTGSQQSRNMNLFYMIDYKPVLAWETTTQQQQTQ